VRDSGSGIVKDIHVMINNEKQSPILFTWWKGVVGVGFTISRTDSERLFSVAKLGCEAKKQMFSKPYPHEWRDVWRCPMHERGFRSIISINYLLIQSRLVWICRQSIKNISWRPRKMERIWKIRSYKVF
jgi:hypothetical protein